MPPLHLRKYWLPLVLVPVLMGIASSAQGQPPGGDPRWKNQGPQLPTKKFNAEEYFAKQSESMKATMATNEKAQAESFAKNWRFTSILATPLLWIAVALTLFSI